MSESHSRRAIIAEMMRVAIISSAAGHSGLAVSQTLAQATPKGTTRPAAADRIINVLDFGADPTAQRNSDDAIARAIDHSLQVPDKRFPLALHFPAGKYVITNNSWLRPARFERSIHSWLICGDGPGSTTISFRPQPRVDTTDYYIYDGASCLDPNREGQTLMGLRVWAIQFHFDCSDLTAPSRVHAFRQCGLNNSYDPEQFWTFDDCYFRSEERFRDRIGSVLEIMGNANGSENGFMNCRARFMRHVISCSNPQAVNHLSLNCHWELMLGDLFRFVRGGNLCLVGGSIIIDSYEKLPFWRSNADIPPGSHIYSNARVFRALTGGYSAAASPNFDRLTTTDGNVEWQMEADESIYLLRVGGDVTGQINTFYITGCRVELRSQRAKLFAGGDLNTAALVVFDSLAVQPVIGGFRRTVEIAESRLSVHFRNCKIARASRDWDEPFAVDFGPGPDRDYPRRALSGPRVVLDGCEVSEKLHELCRWQPNSTASITVLNANIAYHEPSRWPGSARLHVVDGTVSAANTSLPSTSSRVPKFIRQVLVPFSHWPVRGFDRNTPTDAVYVTFPPQTVIDEIVLCRTISSGSSAEYKIAVTDVKSNKLLYESGILDFRTPFRIITPRLFAFKRSETLEIAIWGSTISPSPVPVAADDFIAIQCY